MNKQAILDMYRHQHRVVVERLIDDFFLGEDATIKKILDTEENAKISFQKSYFKRVREIIQDSSSLLAENFWKEFGYKTIDDVVMDVLSKKFDLVEVLYSCSDDSDDYENEDSYDESYEDSYE